MTKFKYKIWSINEEDRWLFIQSDDKYKMDFEEPDAFIYLVKTICSHLNGNIVSLGMTQYSIDNDQCHFIYQWDDLFGIVVIYPENMTSDLASRILKAYLADSWHEWQPDDKCIFRYQLQDAWGLIASEIAVFENLQGGVVRTVIYHTPTRFPDTTTSSKTQELILKPESVDRITGLMRKHEDVFSIDTLEDNWVLDGVINKMEFSLDEKKKEITAYNLWTANNRKNRKKCYNETPVKSMKVLELFNEITNELISLGVDKKCFLLDIDYKNMDW